MKRTKPDSATLTTCPSCTHADPVHRHKHWLSIQDIAAHLRTSLPPLPDGNPDEARISGILLWVYTMHERYGGMVDEHGRPLSAWEARQIQQRQYEKTYSTVPEPRTAKGRQRAFAALVSLLTASRSAHAAPWLLMLTEHFDEKTVAEEGNWTDYQRCLADYERSLEDPDAQPWQEPVNTRPIIALATAH